MHHTMTGDSKTEKRDALEFRAAYLANMESCHFPTFGSEIESAKRRLSTKVQLLQATDIEKLATDNGFTLPSLLRAAWGLVLRCYTGKDDVCFGYLETGRNNPVDGAHKTADNHAGMAIVRMLFDESATLNDIVEKSQEDYVKGLPYHQYWTTDDATGVHPKERQLFNTALMLRNDRNTATAAKAAASARSTGVGGAEECSVRLHAKLLNRGMSIFLEWWSSDMSTEQAQNIASTFSLTLNNIIAHPKLLLAELDYFSERNGRQVLEWNGAPLEKVDRCVHEVIHDQVLSQPTAPAVCAWDERFNYTELDDYAARLAHHLIGLGVGPDVLVPLSFEKSAWNIVAMLGVLKAGGAFVPLDPSHPIGRLQSLVSRLGAKVLLCSSQLANKLESVAETIISIDRQFITELPLPSGADILSLRAASHNLAYVIFTSGTTGEPKGAMVEHAAYCSSAAAHGPGLLMTSECRVLQFAAHTFDASLVEILTTLMLGACVCIPSEERRLNDIAGAMNDMAVNWAVLTPSFISFLDPSMVPGLRTLVLAGEAMSQGHLNTWSSKVRLVNGYGPSECSVASVANSKVSRTTDPTNIGRAIGVHCWVADPWNHNRLVPVGCIGELLIEGPTLARGYLNDPQRTSEAFVENPAWPLGERASATPTRRVYKTGDLVRYNSDGSLTFVGRKDTQVKLHGQRIELGEIEYHLNADQIVKHGLVLLPKAGYCKQRLLAVLSLSEKLIDDSVDDGSVLKLLEGPLKESAALHVATARKHLAARLPAHMVPSMWLVVNSIPLLTSGKLDRKKVAKWVEDMSEDLYHQIADIIKTEENLVTPANEVESQLQTIWSHVLNLPLHQVGLNRSYLSLGGDSISAMQVMAQCQKRGIGVTVQEILRSKSISQLASCAKPVGRPSYSTDEVVEQSFELSPIQQLYFRLPNQGLGHFNQSFFLRITRRTKPHDLQRAVEALISRHSMLRARFTPSSAHGEWQQRITEDIASSYRFRIHDIDAEDEATAAIAQSQSSLDATNGPLFAVDLFNVSGADQLLFMVGHHLVIDLVSWRVILEELEDLLESGPSALVGKPLPFQVWCRLQAEHCQRLVHSLNLPFDKVPASNFAYWGMEHRRNTYGDVACDGFEVDATITSLFLTKCHDALRTEPVDVLLSALIHSFGQVFPDRDVPAVYNEGHGREPWDPTLDLSRTVGWFTIMYPVFRSAAAANNLVETVRQVKDLRRQVPDNGRLYFASRCLTAEGRERFQHHWPLEITFNYLGQYQQLERAGALLRPFEEMAGEARGAGGRADTGHDTPRFGLFEISAVIAKGKLRFSFTFNRYMQHQDSIRRWILNCKDTLKSATEQLSQLQAQATLSDFPLLSLTYDGLAKLTTQKLPQLGLPGFAAVESAFPCSPMQQGLLLSQTRNTSYYAVQVVHEVKATNSSVGRIDSQRLAEAWQRVVDRHGALRTIFIESLSSQNSLFDQLVLKEWKADVAFLACDSDTDALRAFEQQEPVKYDESRRPPHRFTVCQTSAGKVFCKLEISHTIMDGASTEVLFRDLALAYERRLPAGSGPLYGDYIAYLQSQPFKSNADKEFWKCYLADIEPCHFPVLDDGNAAPRELRSVQVKFDRLPELQKFCNENGVTLPNAIHTAWALTLNSYTGSDDTCFGYLASGRDAPVEGIEDVVGPLINMLVCRVKVAPTATLDQILNQVQKDYLDSVPYRHTSLADVQHELRLSGTALFNTAVSYRKLPSKAEAQRFAVEFCECVPTHDPTEYDVSLNIEASDDDAFITLDYWTDSLSDWHANNVASTFVQSLYNAMQNSRLPVQQLDQFSDLNRQQVWGWNAHIPEVINDCVHRVIERQAQLRPSAPAVCAWDAEFTYAELDRVTTRLAHYLVDVGVMPEMLVPICFDKSAYTIVAMIGVHKAGGACVPLDATHPKSSLERRVLDTQASIVVAAPQRAELFEDIVPDVVAIDAAFLDELPDVDGAACTAVHPANPSFVIYTSGSTGQPKGVVLEHRAIVTSAEAHGSVAGIGPDSRVLQFAAYTFDNSLEEMFTTLMRGGCVCVPSDHDRMNNLAEAVNKLRVNWMDVTPTVINFLQPSDVPGVKTLVLGGEALTKRNVEVWGSAVSLNCFYGPSECSINCTWNGNLSSRDPTNIGKAIGSVSWVVDPSNHDRLAPVGSVGELLIEGPIVARGYLNDRLKTSKSFIEGPAWAVDSQNPESRRRRMYKTGDLVRYNSDGTMTYVGRKDTQVKLHGQRIELGEIEYHVKRNLPAGSQSAVELVSLTGSPKALAAFVCMHSDESLAASAFEEKAIPMSEDARSAVKSLEVALSTALPTYMVPSMYILVGKMPMTTSGKLDRRRLRLLAQALTDEEAASYRLAGKSRRAPTTRMEKALQMLWEKVLSLKSDSVGIDDNFFRLGGDSVAAIQLVNAARAEGILLSVANMFQQPHLSEMATCAAMAGDVGQQEVSQTLLEPFSLLKTGQAIEPLKDEVAAECRVASASLRDIYPCSALQEGMIALSTRQPGAYVAQNIYQLPEAIDIERFRDAWQTVVRDEAILRTRIVYTKTAGLVQAVVDEPITWHAVSRLEDLAADDRQLPAHNGGPLTRYTIVNDGVDGLKFVWTVHHALYDGWSLPLIFGKVESAYRSTEPETAVGTVPYARFIQYLAGVDSAKSDDFWRSKLSDLSSLQFPHLPNAAYQVRPQSKVEYTARVSRESGTDITLATMIRAAWAVVLAAHSSSDDVVYGETVTGRDVPVPGIAEMVGPALATVPIRIRVDRELSVKKYLETVQRQSGEMMQYQHAGLQRIKQLSDDAAAACDFQNVFVVNYDGDDSESDFLKLLNSESIESNFYTHPLIVACTIAGAELKIKAQFDNDIIPAWLVERILCQFGSILEQLNPKAAAAETVGSMELLSQWDRETVLSWNSQEPVVVNDCVHHIIQRHALSQPQADAVCSWDANFSYHELDQLSTRLAHHLTGLGVGRDELVPLCFEKSAWTIVAMLAVMKAGGAFVPLDPTSPVARLQGIVSDAGAKIILCSPQYRRLCEGIVAQTIAIDRRMINRLPAPRNNLPTVGHHNLAYVIFTSGTTGKPKGTLIEHAAFCSGAAAHGPATLMKPTSRVLQFASYTFDASVLEILTTLTLGGCVCVPSEDERLNDIASAINEMGVTLTLLTPSFAQLIPPESVPGLQTLILGGEAMSQSHIATWSDKVSLVNAYGPTECSVVAAAKANIPLDTDPANIGRAVGGRCWIVDAQNPDRLAPIGATGELLIEGPTLARGYLNEEQKTAYSFIQGPKWAGHDNKRRMYRTGDLAKYDSDGSLIFLGRSDRQVKLHGQRLELGEVENHLGSDPLLLHALAMVPASGYCKKQLVAVLSMRESVAPKESADELKLVVGEGLAQQLATIRDRLAECVPAYMVPSKWVVAQDIPLLPSGKLDRGKVTRWVENMNDDMYRQISNLEAADPDMEARATETERRLQAILGTVLNLPPNQIGLHLSFLRLGGDSISAMQFMTRCRMEGIGLTVQDILQSKSISQLALVVSLPEEQLKHDETVDEAFDLSPIQQLYLECMGDVSMHFNQSVLLRVTRKTQPRSLIRAIEAVAGAHSMLRARFSRNDAGVWQQHITSDASASYTFRVHSVPTEDGDEIRATINDSQTSLDVEHGPIFAVDLFNVKRNNSQLLFIAAHHLVIDVVSWRIILQDLETLLDSGALATQSSLPFQTWCQLQAERSRQEKAERFAVYDNLPAADLAYWGMDGRPNTYGDVVTDSFDLDPATTQLLLGPCHDALRTEVVDVLLAAVAHSFRDTFADRDVPAVFNEGHGREPWDSKHDLSGTVGWFTTLSPFSLPSSSRGDEDVVNSVRSVKDVRRRMPEKGRAYFAYRLLTPEGKSRFAGHWPMEIAFNYLGQFQQLERKTAILQPLSEPAGESVNNASDIGSDVPRFALFEVSASVTHGHLSLSFGYNRHIQHQDRVRRWVASCQDTLRDAVARLAQMEAEPTLSDFPLLPLTSDSLRQMAGQLSKIGISGFSDVEEAYPCSAMQQGMLLSQLKNPQFYAYKSLLKIRSAKGQHVDAQRLVEAWRMVVQRHATLRTIFIESACQKGLVDQVVLRQTEPRISVLECQDSEVQAVLSAQQPISFSGSKPPHRFSLCRTSSGQLYCKIEINHAISDGTSIPVLLRDLSRAYEKMSLEAGPRFSDYIAYLQTSSRQENVDYWKGYLDGIEPCYFPTLNDGKKEQRQLLSHELEVPHLPELLKFCTEKGVTLSNVLQLVWALVLRCYSGQDEVCFGYLTSGRNVPVNGIDQAVGAFINMLVCRMILSDATILDQALGQVQSDFVASMAHQNCSLAEVQHALRLSGATLFNTVFTFQNRTQSGSVSPSELLYDLVGSHDPSEYNITVNAEQMESRLVVSFSFWSDSLSSAQAGYLADTFGHVLRGVVERSGGEVAVGEIDFLGPQSARQVEIWNRESPAKIDKCIHQLIEQQVALQPPTKMAICAWDGNYTYRELDKLTTKLAGHLRGLGVGPETFVPLCFEKSAWAIIAMIGVLKAGGAYVSLDPAHPMGRIKHIVQNVKAKLILCSSKHQNVATTAAETALVVDHHTLSCLPDRRPALLSNTATGANAAYIIFTSGTTGLPKGTVVEHAALCTSATAHGKAMLMGPTTRALQFASYTFDACVMEIFSTLIVGGCVCVPNDHERLSDIAGVINRMAANWTFLTPSVAATIDPASIPTMKVLCLGGEALSNTDVARWTGRLCVIGGYGPTECTIISATCVHLDESGRPVSGDATNIGYGRGIRCWVMHPKDHNRLVPVGSTGELVLEGPIVAREYLGDKERTAKSFITRSTAIEKFGPIRRMYKTGDLVHYNSDGSVGFVARKDTQIKLRGQRIELGEIEHHVRLNLPGQLQGAVELVTAADNNNKALAVFFTVLADRDDSHLNAPRGTDLVLPMSDAARSVAKNLESTLTGALPVYMVPSLYIPISNMPWSTAGKLDRRKLRDVVHTLTDEELTPYRLADSGSKRAPVTQMEKRLQRLWESALKLKPNSVGLDDSFFRLGGDSVVAMQLVTAARSEGISLTVLDVFQKSRLCEMAEAITTLTEDAAPEVTPFSLLPAHEDKEALLDELAGQCRISKEQIQDVYPCSSLQEGLITLSVKQAGAYVAKNVFQLRPDIDVLRFKDAWQQVVDDEDILRTRVVHTKSSGFLQVVTRAEEMGWHYVDKLQSALEEEQRLPTYNGGPLAKYILVGLHGRGPRSFVWAIHHALYDGWSMALVLRKVEAAYLADQGARLGISPYTRFINYLLKSSVETSDAFWRSRLLGASPICYPSMPHTTNDQVNSGKSITHSAQISRDATGSDITMPTVIRAAWALLMAAYTGSDDVVFGETLTGRDIPVPGITDIVGPTLTTVPTRIPVDREMSVAKFLQDVQRRTVEAIPHQHAGLHHIKKLGSDAAIACEFQNLLVVHYNSQQASNRLWEVQNDGVQASFLTYPLVVECRVNEPEVEIEAHYDDSVISAWQVQRLLYQLESAVKRLNAALTSEDTLLGRVELVSPQDMEVLSVFNGHQPPLIEDTAHHLFEQKVLAQPHAPAVCAWDGDFTYRELDECTTRLASHLVQLGVGPEVMVPMCFEKSIWAIVAIFGILKAGGAFVPLNPDHPMSRHREITDDISAKLILCSPEHVKHCAQIVSNVVVVDEISMDQLPAPSRMQRLSSRATGDNTAYVIFTSGSSGKPKGTVIEHTAFCTSAAAHGPGLLVKPTSRLFQFASYTFDASVLEVLTALTMGACVCIPSDHDRINDVAGAINRMNVTWTLLTPSVASTIEPSDIPCLETLVSGGEAMSMETLATWGKSVSLVNAYGPTECTIIATGNTKVVEKSDPSNIGPILPSAHAWIVDPADHNRLAPVGAVGELLIEGPILARGYLDAKKTAEAFIENPTWATAGASGPSRRRMYKTGDLVRYEPDGSLAIIGRKDYQVKLHGQRLELGEIEHRLEANPLVRHALVVMPKSGYCQKRLVAVLALHDIAAGASNIAENVCKIVEDGPRMEKARWQVAEIRSRLEDELPSYMVPAQWVVLEGIPFLPSGKLDRTGVTRWATNVEQQDYDRITSFSSTGESVSASTATTKIIQQIWAHVLNLPVDKIGLNQSFLSLGGDSVTAMQVMARCRKENISVSMHDILRSKSIPQLALSATAVDRPSDYEEKIDSDFELSPIQQLYLGFANPQMPGSHFNQSFMLRLAKRIQAQDVVRAVEAIISQHSMLRARFRKAEDGSWKQRITRALAPSYRFRVHTMNTLEAIVPSIADSQASLDIQQGPLLAVDLFNLKGADQVLFLAAHHLVIDLMSWRIILQDLEELLNSGTLSDDKPLSFQAWSAMQAEHAQQNISQGDLPFYTPPSNVGYWGMANRQNTYGDVEQETFQLDPETSALALAECHKALRTEPVDLFLAAILHSFGQVFVDRDVPALFNESHGREPWDSSIDLSRTVGWFTTMYPVHVPVTDEEDAVETMRHIKDTRRRISQNGRPYFASRFLTPESRDEFSKHMPLEILFNYLGQYQQMERDDSLLQQMEGPKGAEAARLTADVGKNTSRFALFEISAVVLRGRIQFSFMYNRHMLHQNGIRRWLGECRRTLQRTVSRLMCLQPKPTLSDFPLLPLSYDGLQQIVDKTFPELGLSGIDEVEDIYPCAPTQEGLLLSQLRDPELYMFRTAFEVKAVQPGRRVDPLRLTQAWQKVVDRHPALRTVFIESVCREGAFDQVVLKNVNGGAIWIQSDDSDMLSTINAKQAFKVKEDRLPHRVIVQETSAGKVFFAMEINHAVIDGGSVSVLMQDLARAYDNQLPDAPGPLYSAFIAYIQSRPAEDIGYWKKYLEGATPSHLPKLGDDSKQRSLHTVQLKFDGFSQLHSICETANVTLSNIIQVAWGLVLRTYTHSDEVCFGYITSGRDIPVDGTQEAVGAFINMLVCRVRLTPSLSLMDIFQTAQNDYLQSQPYQHCSLARIHHELGIPARQTLFDTIMSIQNHSTAGDAERTSIAFEHLVGHDPSEYVTVNIEASRGNEGVVVRYWTDILSDGEAEKMMGKLAHVLGAIVDGPQRTVAELIAPTETAQRPAEPVQPKPAEMLGQENVLRKMIGDCVREVMQEILQAGNLGSLNANDVTSLALRKAAGEKTESRQESAPSDREMTPKDKGLDVGADKDKEIVQVTPPAAAEDASRVDMEKKLLALWAVLLKKAEDAIGVNDSFFNLGGDSIIAMKMVAAARAEGIALTVANIFRNPTIAGLASVARYSGQAISSKNNSETKSSRPIADVRIQPADQRPIASESSVAKVQPFKQEASASQVRSDAKVQPIAWNASPKQMFGDASVQRSASTHRDDYDAIVQEAARGMKTYQLTSYDAKAQLAGQEMDSYQPKRDVAIYQPPYQPFSLLNVPNVHAFLQDCICPHVQVFRGGIADVFPTTDFQSLAITGTLLESRWMLNYFFLDGRGALDLRQLKQSVFRLVQTYEILRTVFVPHGSRYLQVVLRKLEPEFRVFETDQDLDEFTLSIQQKDRAEGPHLGESYVQFTVAKRRGSNHHRIIIRLSHAQYDGVCLPSILYALQSGYHGQPMLPAPPFSTFVRGSVGGVTPEHYEHWRNLLRGSSMTAIVQRDGPNYNRAAGEVVTLKQKVMHASLALENITPATVIKAAWSMVLAQLSGKPDVVFGHVISGRNATIPDVEDIIGPCLNMVPVRIKLEPGWTVLDLLRYLQEQQVSNMPYESLGFREIVKNCTDWPKWTNFSSLVQHQNVARDSKLELGGTDYTVGGLGSQEDFADLTVLSIPRSHDETEVSLTFSVDSAITPPWAEKVLNMLCTAIASFSANPHMRLPSPSQLAAAQRPVPAPSSIKAPGMRDLSAELQRLGQQQLQGLTEMLNRAWRQVLGDDGTRLSNLNLGSSFYELGGDIMGAGQVASLLEQEGFTVRVEDLIDHPRLLDQLALLSMRDTRPAAQRGLPADVAPAQAPPGHGLSRKASFGDLWKMGVGLALRKVRQKTGLSEEHV